MRIVLVVTALVLAACAGGTTVAEAPVAETSTTVTQPAVTSSTAGDATTSTAAEDSPTSTRPAPNPDRPLAPDFSLTLSDGTEYTYESEVRPVFMVFWAEW